MLHTEKFKLKFSPDTGEYTRWPHARGDRWPAGESGNTFNVIIERAPF